MNAIESIELNATSLHERELTVTVAREAVDREFANTVNNVQRLAQHKGFRPGKMPKEMVLKLYSGEIKGRLKERLFEKSFDSACEQENIIPVSPPKWSPLAEVEPAKSFTYRAVFQVKPKVASPVYRGLKVELKKVCYTEKDVDDEIADIQASMATFVEPSERSDTRDCDLVMCDSVVMVDGVINERLSQRDYAVALFADDVPEELKKALMGKKRADVASAHYTVPANNQDPEIAGKSCEMILTVKSIKERVLPAIDDELAKDLSEKLTSLDDLKRWIRLRFDLMVKQRDYRYRQEAFAHALVDENPLEVPDALVRRAALTMMNREFETIDKNAMEDLVKNHWAEMWEEFTGRAQFRVRAELLMEALFEELAITATDGEVFDMVKAVKDMSEENAAHAIKVDKLIAVMEAAAAVTITEEPLFDAGQQYA
ncbi:MAG TPA: trigger factor [Myxococcota bacterium]|nr:trigger factor [Myxococcota bacterium]